jgi:hypothetical protein
MSWNLFVCLPLLTLFSCSFANGSDHLLTFLWLIHAELLVNHFAPSGDEIVDGRPGTLVIESFVVDVPEGNTKDETCYFVQALIRCNLKSLAYVSERLAVQDRTEPIDRIKKLGLGIGQGLGLRGMDEASEAFVSWSLWVQTGYCTSSIFNTYSRTFLLLATFSSFQKYILDFVSLVVQ